MTRRGVTLIEVLVSLFVLAIGVLAIITLFPLGALTMAQAIKDDRAATVAATAAAIADATNLRTDPGPRIYGFPVRTAFYDPGAGLSPISEEADSPSYPVLIDAVGNVPFGSNPPAGGVVPRRNPSYIRNNADVFYWFTLLDDISFNESGEPLRLFGGPIQRESLYSWAYLLRRPRCASRRVVDLTVLVFRGRPLTSLTPVGETLVGCPTQPAGTTVIPLLTSAPIRRGGWMMDVTQETTPEGRQLYGPLHGDFHRVVGTTQGALTYVELQTPLRAPANRFLIFDNLVEVFEKGFGWKG